MADLAKEKSRFFGPLYWFGLVTALFCFKTYVAYRLEFELGVQGLLQEFLLLVNPVGSALFLFAFVLLAKEKKRVAAYAVMLFLLSAMLYINVLYYRFFNDFITFPVLLQTQNFGDLGGSTQALANPLDVFYFLDVLLILVVGRRCTAAQRPVERRTVLAVFTAAIFILAANTAMAEAENPQLLTKTYNRNDLVQYLGIPSFAFYDTVQTVYYSAQRTFAQPGSLTEVKAYRDFFQTEPNNQFAGAAENMNVIYISLESLQSFVLGYELHGEEVTPFLNSLMQNKNTLFFPNFFHQTAQGKTSDAEFMMENALYPLPKGSAYVTKAHNTYEALPVLLEESGFQQTASFHGNERTFWNRENMYKAAGYDRFYAAESYSVTKENTVNYGLKDKVFFNETIPYLEAMPQPFYAKLITLSNHFPYVMDEQDATIEPAFTSDEAVNRYFQTVRYLDEALEQFFQRLQQAGLYNNTMIVLYGDHYGLSHNKADALEQMLEKEVTPYVQQQLQRVPFFIHIPGNRIEGGTVETYGGQVDVRPTVLRLLGVEAEPYLSFGTDLLASDRLQIVLFRNGDFVTPAFSSINGKLYRSDGTGMVQTDAAAEVRAYVNKNLFYSDRVIYGDLLRFQQP